MKWKKTISSALSLIVLCGAVSDITPFLCTDTNASYLYSESNNKTAFPKVYNISAVSNDDSLGTVVGGETQLETGVEVTLTAFPSESAKFEYWEDSKGNKYTANPLVFEPTHDETYIGYFKYNIFTITAQPLTPDCGSVAGSGNFKGGTNATIKFIPSENCIFDYWEDSNGNKYTKNPYTFKVHESITYTAHPIYLSYKLSVDYDHGCGKVDGEGSFEYGDKFSLTASPFTGYDFAGWTDETGSVLSTELTYSGSITDNTSLKALFTPRLYNISIAAEHGSAQIISSPEYESDGKYYFGKEITLKALPDDGYVFLYWKKGNSIYSTYETTGYTLGQENDLTAVFKEKEHRDETVSIDGITYQITDSSAYVVKISNSMKDVVIPSVIEGVPVNTINEDAFGENSVIRNITIPSFMTTKLSYPILKDCQNLENIYVENEGTYFRDIDGVLYSKDLKELIYYPPCHGQIYTIPEGTEIITANAFMDCDLSEVEFPVSLSTIGTEAFRNCSLLKEIILPEGLEYIDKNAFSFCESLETVFVPASVKQIENGAFRESPKLSKITIEMTSEGIIDNAQETICNMKSSNDSEYIFTGTIYGPKGCAAEIYAIKNGYVFSNTSVQTGDVNMDGVVDVTDDITLARFIADWEGITVDPITADINKDGKISMIDSVILSRYLADWTEYEVYFS